jgi:hypothetical protein
MHAEISLNAETLTLRQMFRYVTMNSGQHGIGSADTLRVRRPFPDIRLAEIYESEIYAAETYASDGTGIFRNCLLKVPVPSDA